jgi:hypothetical protein
VSNARFNETDDAHSDAASVKNEEFLQRLWDGVSGLVVDVA